jgi:hypothetical protein
MQSFRLATSNINKLWDLQNPFRDQASSYGMKRFYQTVAQHPLSNGVSLTLFVFSATRATFLRFLHIENWTAKRRHLGRVGGAKRPSGRNKDLHAAL